jgi:hypothetical protein
MSYNHELVESLRNVCETPADEDANTDLYHKLIAGDRDARDEMITSNMPMAIAIVDTFLRGWPRYAHLRDDLQSAGFLGLTEAVNALVAHTRATILKPSDYLGRGILNAIRDVVKTDAPVRPPRRSHRAPPTVTPIETSADAKVMLSTSREPTEACIDLQDLIASCCQSDIETQIISLRSEGHTFAEIGDTLGLARRTAVNMFYRIRARFDEKTAELA